jgi:hypothetical protein
MGYMKIQNLYKSKDILLFREAFALEKIHGTSAHIGWNEHLYFYSGGENYNKFKALFNEEFLTEKFKEMLMTKERMTIYGEAYGGKCQGMSDTYGKELKFVAFDVKIGDCWLDVRKAENIVTCFGLDFVPYLITPTDLHDLDNCRDYPSIQAKKNGINENKKREGIVLRPLIEVIKNNGERIICKHKRDDFRETKTPRNITDGELKVLTDAKGIADEWVTSQRLNHVLDKCQFTSIECMGEIIKAMVEDIEIEAAGEIVFSKEARKEISRATAQLFKQRVIHVEI